MKFVDREHELQTLEKQYQRADASFLVVYGRRRTGKTTLLTEFCKTKPHVYFLASETGRDQNLAAFQDVVRQSGFLPDTADIRKMGWKELLSALVPEGLEHRIVVVFDEFQYLGLTDPSFPSVLQGIWDLILQYRNILLILCGSHVHMMEQQALNYNSPLYGRRTGQIRLTQIPFEFYPQFLPEGRRLSFSDLVEYYAVTGGIPKYASLFLESQAPSLWDAIRTNVLEPDSVLRDEPHFLLNREIAEEESPFLILEAIADGSHKLSHISRASGVPAASLEKPLRVLEDLDLIERESPVTDSFSYHSKRSVYRIRDNFIAFWFRYVFPSQQSLGRNKMNYVLEHIREDFRRSHCSFVFEDICRDLVWDYYEKGRLPVAYNKVGRWWDNNSVTEIDVVGLNEQKNEILFGECKFRENRPVDIDVCRKLRAKAARVSWRKKDRKETFVLFSVSGFTPQLWSAAASDPRLVLLDPEQDPPPWF